MDVAELVDALDLGPSNFVVRVRVSPSTFNFVIRDNYIYINYFILVLLNSLVDDNKLFKYPQNNINNKLNLYLYFLDKIVKNF